jgi:dCTP diphosphatase
MDQDTTLDSVRRRVAEFTKERAWGQFHNGKDLAISISLEAGELLEEFQWLTPDEVSALERNPEGRERVRLELADVLIYCFCLANALDMDVSSAVSDKLEIAALKYPAAPHCDRRPGKTSLPGAAR